MKYRLAALGGTFDRFHHGHQQLIDTALENADHVVVGVTQSPLMSSKILPQLIQSYNDRVDQLQSVVNKLSVQDRVSIIPLTDVFGPTLTDQTIDALVVSSQTKPGADHINLARSKNNLKPLPIVEAKMISDESGNYLSSTAIRQGLVSRTGRVYRKLFDQDIIFDADTLVTLKHPQGELIHSRDITPHLLKDFTSTTLVGDIITHHFINHHLPFNAAIIDGVTRRNQIIELPQSTIDIHQTNQPGRINQSVSKHVIRLLQTTNQPIIKVSGEEDLLAFIPALINPLNSAVLYGQGDDQIVMIHLTETIKTKLARMIDITYE